METETRRKSDAIMNIVDVEDQTTPIENWETNKETKRMQSKFWSKFSKLFLNESMEDEKQPEKNIFQDFRGSVTVPNEDKVSYWLRRRRRENASEKTFFVPRPQRPLRFRTIPPLLFPALYALPALIGGVKIYFTKSTFASFSSQEWELAWLSSAQDRSMGQPCPHLLLLVTLSFASSFAESLIWSFFFFRNIIFRDLKLVQV